ncbi:uncharacterized protein TNCV_82801 [Trichonephila clavipes]|nr:uncharacterized protein TNCV_82801 [Trichonephila clavipes]
MTFSEYESAMFCINSNRLMIELKISHDPLKWRQRQAFKLAIGNDLPSVPYAYSVDIKETYENISQTFDKICYHDCIDLKVVLLANLQTSFTKYCCFLCEALWKVPSKGGF